MSFQIEPRSREATHRSAATVDMLLYNAASKLGTLRGGPYINEYAAWILYSGLIHAGSADGASSITIERDFDATGLSATVPRSRTRMPLVPAASAMG
jgi:hypothetical protein